MFTHNKLYNYSKCKALHRIIYIFFTPAGQEKPIAFVKKNVILRVILQNIPHSSIDLFVNQLYSFYIIRFSIKYCLYITYYISEEDVMFEVTSTAVQNLKEYLSQNNIDSAVRIALMQGG